METPRFTRFAGFNGVSLAADVRGDDDAWPVLLMHGSGQTRHAWGSTAQTLARHGWRTITLDLRGHGDSEWAPDADYSFGALAADCAAVCERLGRPPVLVGASAGGGAAVIAEGTAESGLASALVVVDITPHTNLSGVQRIRAFMQQGMDGFETLTDAAAAIAAYTPNRRRPVNEPGLMKVLRLHEDGRWHWHWDPRFLGRMNTVEDRDRYWAAFEVALDHVRIPTLLVRGMLSDVVTDEGVKDFLARVPGSRLADVKAAGHMVAGDQNDSFSTAVVEFLDTDVRPALTH